MREPVYYSGNTKGIFDTHAHLYDERFASEGLSAEDILFHASRSGIDRILIPADNEETSLEAIDFVKRYDGTHGVKLFCSVGVHPHEAKSYDDTTGQKLIGWLEKKDELKIKALGEIGLDYHYDLSPRPVQKSVFARQIPIAKRYDLPMILHEREATADTLEILKTAKANGELRGQPGVCHCCSASAETAAILLDMGFYIGFDGPLTFKNNKNTVRLCEAVPLDRIVIETDSPYLTPEPNRGSINEPAHVAYVAERIAQIKNVTVEEVVKITACNGMRLYGLGEEI